MIGAPRPGTLNQGHTHRERIQKGGATVLDHLVATFGHSDEATWRARLGAGELELDGQPARAEDLLRAGQTLAWHRPPWVEPWVDLDFKLVFEDEHLLAVSKPRGLPTMPAGGLFLEHTLLHAVRKTHPEASPMHRLGRETSGLVLFARTPQAASALQSAWRNHQVHKRYRTLVTGHPAWESLTIEAPIGPVQHPLLGTLFAAHPGGKAAHSHATVLAKREANAVLQVDIRTGRPHQIRIHMAWAGHPLMGDPLYGVGGLPRPDALPGEGGYFLHAERLGFPHPVFGIPISIEDPLPEGWPLSLDRFKS